MIRKRNIIAYGIFLIFKLVVFLVLYFGLSKMPVLATITVNLVIPLIALFIIAAALNFNEKSNIKSCLVHASILTLLTFIISMTTGEIITNRHKDLFNNLGQENISNWLDKQARKYMIEQGIIDEDEEIYSKPFIGEEYIPLLEADGELHAEWEIHMIEQTPMGVATETLIDFVVAFLGGLLGIKLWNKKKKGIKLKIHIN